MVNGLPKVRRTLHRKEGQTRTPILTVSGELYGKHTSMTIRHADASAGEPADTLRSRLKNDRELTP